MKRAMKVLVTGADGFIGSHLVETLVRRGFDTKALVMYNSFNSWGWLDHCSKDVMGEFEVTAGDVRDPHAATQTMQDVDAVLHLASLIAIPYSYRAAESYLDTNVRGTLNMLQAARAANVQRFVHTSTSEVYGTAQFVPITEEHPLKGQSPYSATKIAADQLALSFHASFDLPVVIARPFNTYGPRQSARAIIPSVITQIASGKTSLELGALTPTRDFNYVMDTVSGFISAMESTLGCGEVVNFASNFEVSVFDTVKMISDIMGVDVQISLDDQRLRPANSEVERLWGDNKKAADLFGWKPKYSGKDGFRSGLARTIEWFTNPENLATYKPDSYNT